MSQPEIWDNPLVTRYASRAMAELWSPQRKFSTWRKLWVALAEAERELGLTASDGVSSRISEAQIAALRRHVDDVDFEKADSYERRFRHDVMAHVHAYGDACPEARDVIHLGATSCYVTDNADLILMREGLRKIASDLLAVIHALADFAKEYRSLPCLGFTHFQPAQLTTVGKRATLWCYDLVMDYQELQHRLTTLKFRGAKGTTGTQASFLALFKGDHARVRELDRRVAAKMGFAETYAVTGQTYSRKLDSQILDTLSGIAQSAHKFGTDLRLLQHRNEVEEPFEKEQIGSSAMAYKRNPMRSERACGLARYVMNLAMNAAQTAAVQWLERTLDDSVNRRLALPEAFLGTDGVLRLYRSVAAGLVVHPEVIRKNVERDLPFMATEDMLMAAVRQGGDRQELHEVIRRHSHEVIAQVKTGGANDLLERLHKEKAFASVDLQALAEPSRFVGRAPQQVDEFLEEVVAPLLMNQEVPTAAEAVQV